MVRNDYLDYPQLIKYYSKDYSGVVCDFQAYGIRTSYIVLQFYHALDYDSFCVSMSESILNIRLDRESFEERIETMHERLRYIYETLQQRPEDVEYFPFITKEPLVYARIMELLLYWKDWLLKNSEKNDKYAIIAKLIV